MLPARLAPSDERARAARPEVQLSTPDLALINAVQDDTRRLARALLLRASGLQWRASAVISFPVALLMRNALLSTMPRMNDDIL